MNVVKESSSDSEFDLEDSNSGADSPITTSSQMSKDPTSSNVKQPMIDIAFPPSASGMDS